jgi:glycosyltransferase involved in cell wall biosynthesis
MCKPLPNDVSAFTPNGADRDAFDERSGSRPMADAAVQLPLLRIALIGTDGLPVRYGGFETCVAQLAPRLAALGHQVEVFGSSQGRSARSADGPGLRHRYLPMRANGAASIPYDLLSFLLSYRHSDAIVVMGVSAGVFMPLMRWLAGQRRIVVNVDGLEARRSKWKGLPRAFLRLSERLAIRHAHQVVSDNQGIADIVSSTYGRSSTVIPYGNDHVLQLEPAQVQSLLQHRFDLEPGSYLLTVARIEPENQIAEMMEAALAAGSERYVVVGNFSTTDLGRQLLERYCNEPRIQCIDSLFEPQALAALRAGCRLYLHGHSVGGTNPSLIEMLPYGRPILAFDCVFNRQSLGGEGGYFSSATELAGQLRQPDALAWIPAAHRGPDARYQWTDIAKAYLRLCLPGASA